MNTKRRRCGVYAIPASSKNATTYLLTYFLDANERDTYRCWRWRRRRPVAVGTSYIRCSQRTGAVVAERLWQSGNAEQTPINSD